MVAEALRKWFWNPEVWLPPNVTWEDMVPNDNVQYANFEDLYYALPQGFLIFAILRFILIK